MAEESIRETVLAYCNRRWGLVRAAKEEFWAQESRTRGPVAGFAAGEALWVHARAMDPAWPSADSRQADLEHHIALSEKLRRVAHVLARR